VQDDTPLRVVINSPFFPDDLFYVLGGTWYNFIISLRADESMDAVLVAEAAGFDESLQLEIYHELDRSLIKQHEAAINSGEHNAVEHLEPDNLEWPEKLDDTSQSRYTTSPFDSMATKLIHSSLSLPHRPALSPSRSHPSTSSTPRTSKKRRKQSVHFAKSPITGVSRPPTSLEHWTLYYFESHAISCGKCKGATRGPKSLSSMCENGEDLAQDVETLEFSFQEGYIICARDVEAIVTDSSRKKGLMKLTKKNRVQVRVEIPHNYKFCRRLIKVQNGSGEDSTSKPAEKENGQSTPKNNEESAIEQQVSKKRSSSKTRKTSKSQHSSQVSDETFKGTRDDQDSAVVFPIYTYTSSMDGEARAMHKIFKGIIHGHIHRDDR
jgi:hypothetical protein